MITFKQTKKCKEKRADLYHTWMEKKFIFFGVNIKSVIRNLTFKNICRLFHRNLLSECLFSEYRIPECLLLENRIHLNIYFLSNEYIFIQLRDFFVYKCFLFLMGYTMTWPIVSTHFVFGATLIFRPRNSSTTTISVSLYFSKILLIQYCTSGWLFAIWRWNRLCHLYHMLFVFVCPYMIASCWFHIYNTVIFLLNQQIAFDVSNRNVW